MPADTAITLEFAVGRQQVGKALARAIPPDMPPVFEEFE